VGMVGSVTCWPACSPCGGGLGRDRPRRDRAGGARWRRSEIFIPQSPGCRQGTSLATLSQALEFSPWPAAGDSDRTAAQPRRPGASSTSTGLVAHSSSLCPPWASTTLAGPAALAHPPGQQHLYRARSTSAAAAWPGPAMSTSTVTSTSLTRSHGRTRARSV
jgi:hypothetical protein